MERSITTAGGNPITLIGPDLKVGDKAPNFTVLDSDLNEIQSKTFDKKIKLISVVPSLDTGVCDQQTKRFNEEAAKLSDNLVIITISMDLPFAQARWCGVSGVEKVKVYSDHRDADFGNNYGVLIKEMRLLNRSIFVVDEKNIIRYIEIVKEISTHPDYDKVLAFINKL